MTTRRRLDRANAGIGRADPVRMVHLGPGAFFRAHQAWYTDGTGWGIAAVTQRSDDMVGRLGGQDGLYTVVTRGPDGDSPRIVSSVSEVLGHSDPRGVALVADPEVVVVTLTITEAGYRPGSAAIDRLLDGIAARRQHDRPLSLVSCDNLSANSSVLRRRLIETATSRHEPGLAEWIQTVCGFPNTVVDRITPATTAGDAELAGALTGFDDRAAVVTEPFSEWIIEDAFVGERPRWEDAGAVVVPDVEPYQTRKLRLLNAGHSLLAYVGAQRGHTYVHEALADPLAHDALVALWAEAKLGLSATASEGADTYCAGVEVRWSNARLPHQLAQIGTDGSLKLRERIVPTVVAARAAGVEPHAAALALGAWVAYLRGHGSIELRDRQADELQTAAAGDLTKAVPAVLRLLDEEVAQDAWVRAAVLDAARSFEAPPVHRDYGDDG
jgi:fructuronate reductase